MIIDGKNLIFGRLCSHIAVILRKEEVILVNSEKIIRKGSARQLTQELLAKKTIGRKNTVSYMVKRSMRSMLPRNNTGKELLKKLKVYEGIPQRLEKSKMIKMHESHREGNITLGEIVNNIKNGKI